MKKYYLAVDIGASSGRHILGYEENSHIYIEEIYRFENGIRDVNGSKCWDTEYLFNEIIKGMKRCEELDKIPYSMGIDTWAVDFVLLDKNNSMLGNSVAYRDGRTKGVNVKSQGIMPLSELYSITGIQHQDFNTINQLLALKNTAPEQLEKAESFLMIPDYLNYRLTGIKSNEYTNATTTQLVKAGEKDWNYELIESLGLPKKIFRQISPAGSYLGTLTSRISEMVGFDCRVVLPATHDTGSAVVAVPSLEKDFVYLSSGTWSLMGTELAKPKLTKKSCQYNFTNEGGYEKYRYLKNIMGLWMIQSVKKELKGNMSFAELCELAKSSNIKSTVNCNDDVFLAPDSMVEAVKNYCRQHELEVPESAKDIAAVVYNSLADCYAETINEIELLTGKNFNDIYIVGGGSNADYLNQITAKKTSRRLHAGPSEATAIGNIAVLMLADGVFKNLSEVRSAIRESFDIKEYNEKGEMCNE